MAAKARLSLSLFRAILLALALSLGLSACREQSDEPANSLATDEPLSPIAMPDPSPAIWEISKDGKVEGWLFGTIHALPDGTKWRTDEIDTATKQADLLMVEIADLEASKDNAATFYELALTPDEPPLSARLPFGMQGQLRALLAETGKSEREFTSTETWAAALILSQALGSSSKAENGVDLSLIKQFSERKISEVEGVRAQLEVFDKLPEEDQRAMLAVVVREGSMSADEREAPMRAWLAGDLSAMAREGDKGVLGDPDLRQALLVERNLRWVGIILPVLAGEEKPFIAVGGAHMLGPKGLPALLRDEGYSIRRLDKGAPTLSTVLPIEGAEAAQ